MNLKAANALYLVAAIVVSANVLYLKQNLEKSMQYDLVMAPALMVTSSIQQGDYDDNNNNNSNKESAQVESAPFAASSFSSSASSTSSSFVVWMFPLAPKNGTDLTIHSHEQLICPYSSACGSLKGHRKHMINLRTLTENTYFENYVRDHAWHKIRHWTAFPCHIQVITMLSLLRKNPGSCVRILGSSSKSSSSSSSQICDANAYPDYNPYQDFIHDDNDNFPLTGTVEAETGFPAELLLHVDDNTKQSASLVPNLDSELFALYGVYPYDSFVASGKYNTGNDIQWLASSHWLPYINNIRHWKNALAHYKGHLIGNSLLNLFTAPEGQDGSAELDVDAMKRISLTSIFPSSGVITKNMAYFETYTNQVEPFGSRSTVSHRQLLDMRIKTYFSACLTLTMHIQGATHLANPAGVARKFNNLLIQEPLPGTMSSGGHRNDQKSVTNHGIFMVDVADESVVPTTIRGAAHRLYADLPSQKSYQANATSYKERISYAYRLLSHYAKEAKVVITSRIHVGLPSLALGVPVIFVKPVGGKLPGGFERTGRVAGLTELFHNINVAQGHKWTFGDHPSVLVVPPNPGNHAADRYRASFWNRLKRESSYYGDTARIFGMIPLQRLGLKNTDPLHLQDVFHFCFHDEDFSSWQARRAIELVLYHHPNAQVFVHVENDKGVPPAAIVLQQLFFDSGYNVIVRRTDFTQLASRLGMTKLNHNHGATSSSSSFPSRAAVFLLLKTYGGVYVSKSTFLQRAIPMAVDSGVVIMKGAAGAANHEPPQVALMIYSSSSKNGGGASSSQRDRAFLDFVVNNSSPPMSSLPFSWKLNVLSPDESQKCLKEKSWKPPGTSLQNDTSVLGVSLDATTLFSTDLVTLDTSCYEVLEAKCIYCDEVHIQF